MPSSVMTTSRPGNGQQPPAAVSTVGLRKSYGDKTVLGGIDLHIPTGTVFALLGPNGAGKTTAVQILSTLISADGGQA
ncbi:ATP-binding cassette domain-containing protein, partial [Streptomyces sp. NPDC059262]|uniref:ATP-binding cassette domain-containing protein n=1 Tax=Streptomyces sp. NPDC059262 TaxID=3346797 RepID=UPI0036C2A510